MFYKKLRLRNFLMNKAEQMLSEKRSKKRRNKFYLVKYRMRPELIYEDKNTFVENSINDELQYFKNFDTFDIESEDPKFLLKELRKKLSRRDYVKYKILLTKQRQLKENGMDDCNTRIWLNR